MSNGEPFQWNERESVDNFVSKIFGDSSMLLGRLGRSAVNQVDLANLVQSDEEICSRLNVTMSRYAIWAQTAATTLQKYCEGSVHRSEDLEPLREVEKSLRAFVAIQEKFIDHEITDGREL